ncbi:MAG: hypothetical protein A2665_01115 [Candidatus Zambryskibacteria bacterium RIFCSPHIGHO2_01_FULL_46_30]|uniref:Glycosyltransferase n=1 Tax=Candidatus Zambryskibacteria bacterium RIFCSPHIGHO2_01_FULL_46_30 TaxID=1802739 RepID=A0A1G2T1B3_9BACT|nr:MAG: hypothetical protein A2665_01115 [Candidatus Zambryskibacteria bacterium RIFCSPHIGHO2_01_FULL_46_30]OHB06084.1 MAG: hypothetical protein A3B22_02195 [Candidatus Zambryskibacteria bacterium RIFCSPLOWO2_01_FULL_47_33]
MKIAMITDSFYPFVGGSETAIRNLTETLNKAGHDVKVFGVFPEVSSPDERYVPVVKIDPDIFGINLRVFGLLSNLDREIKKFKPDIINAHFMLKSGYLGVKVAKRNNIPSVVTVRGKGVFYKARTIKEKILFSMYRKMSLKSDLMIATSAEMANIVDERWGVRPTPLSNGVDIKRFRPNIVTNLKDKLGIENKKVILCVRRLVPKNGIEYMVRAMPKILWNYPETVLILVAPKLREYKKLDNLACELGVETKIIFAGEVNHDILPQYFSIADVVVQPSIAEARSLSCLEAMASGSAIIATNTGGLGELIQHKVNGFLVPAFEDSTYQVGAINQKGVDNLASAVVEIFSDNKLQKDIQLGARKTAQENSWDNVTKATLDMYKRVIDKKDKIKLIYTNYSDNIIKKRFNSNYPLRKYVHRTQLSSFLNYISEGQKVLDAGCGEGILAVLMAKKGALVTACDISIPNIENAKKFAQTESVGNKIRFLCADIEALPFEDNSFDVVVSSHILEHIPNFHKGLDEVRRVSKYKVIIGLPTCLNLCAMSLLGGAEYWYLRKKSFIALPKGIGRVAWNIFKDGVDEGYGPNKLPHLRRYPWVVKRELKDAGFKIVHFEANSLCLPYFNFWLPIIRFIDRFKGKPILRNLGPAVLVVAEKIR